MSIVLGSLSDAERAGQMLEHEAKALKTVLEDPQMQSLIKVGTCTLNILSYHVRIVIIVNCQSLLKSGISGIFVLGFNTV